MLNFVSEVMRGVQISTVIFCSACQNSNKRRKNMLDYVVSILWIAILVICIVLETRTTEIVTIWFMPAAAVALLLSFFKSGDDVKDLIVQVVAFVVVSLVTFFIFHVSMKKRLKGKKKNRTNLTAMIGEKCLVVEDISNIHSKGAVRFNGLVWSARSLDDTDVIENGTVVVIDGIDGVKLICSREN